MSTPAPRVSVVTSVYNEMPWLPVAIESVLGQTFTDWEPIAVNDGSGAVLDAYTARGARVRVIHRKTDVRWPL